MSIRSLFSYKSNTHKNFLSRTQISLKIAILGVASILSSVAVHAANAPFDRTYLVSTELDNGDKYKQYWVFDNASKNGEKMHVSIIEGPHGGLEDDLVLKNMEISPGVWFINWLALNKNAAQGNTISYVVDFNVGKVWGFFTNNPKAGQSARPFEKAVGSIEVKP